MFWGTAEEVCFQKKEWTIHKLGRANDYLQGASGATIPVENVNCAIASLAGVGAKNILVANLPDLGQHSFHDSRTPDFG